MTVHPEKGVRAVFERGAGPLRHGIASEPWTEYGTRAAGEPSWRCLSAVAPTRVDVWVNRPLHEGWMLAYNPPAWALAPEVCLLRCVERYQRWCQSIRRATVRAQAVQARAVRLLVNGHVAGVCGDALICQSYGIDAEVLGALEPEPSFHGSGPVD